PGPLALDVYPNPTAGRTALAYTLPEAGLATLAVYDVLGRLVAHLADGQASAGAHVAQLATESFASGIYVAVLTTEIGQQTRRFTVLR
ncbi:MAG: T9SS type A sorting domain-containing protein, partial [Bacteroidota bacterium]